MTKENFKTIKKKKPTQMGILQVGMSPFQKNL